MHLFGVTKSLLPLLWHVLWLALLRIIFYIKQWMQPHRARPALDRDEVDGYLQGRAVLKQGGGKGLVQGLGPCSSFWLCQSPGNQRDCYWCCWRRGWAVVMSRGTASHGSRRFSAQHSCPTDTCNNLSSPSRLLIGFFSCHCIQPWPGLCPWSLE